MTLQRLRQHWDRYYVLLIVVISFGLIYLPFFLYNDLNQRDLSGHLYSSWFIKEYLFPGFSGWNPFHFLGFPQGELYPFLVHYLVALLGFVMDIGSALKAVIVVSGILIPVSIYSFSKVVVESKTRQIILFSIIYGLLLVVPGYVGFSINAVFSVGLVTSFVSIPLVFLFLANLFGNGRLSIGVILLSAIILSHIVSGVVVILITLGYLAVHYHNKISRKRTLKILTFSFLLTCFYTIPFLAFRKFTVSPKTDPIPYYLFLTPFFFSVLAAGLLYLSKLQKYLWIVVVTALVSLGFFVIGYKRVDSFINTIHPYRFFGYMLITTVTIFLFCYFKVKKIQANAFIKKLETGGLIILAIGVPIFLYVRNFDTHGRDDITVNLDGYRGTFAANYRTADILDQTRDPYFQPLYTNEDIRFINGQFEESAYNAPYTWSLAKGYIDPGEVTESIEDIRFDPETLQAGFDYFGVNHSLNTGEFKCPDSNNEQLLTFDTSCLESNQISECTKTLYTCELGDERMFEVWTQGLTSVPESSWGYAAEQWWKNGEFTEGALVEGDIPFEPSESDYTITTINHSRNWDSFDIRIEADRTVPVLVRMSYFPKWRAYQNGKEISIYRISPNLMMIYANAEVQFRYENTWIEILTMAMSLTTLVGLVMWFFMMKRSRKVSK